MNESGLPFKRPVGIQLATGIVGPSVFRSAKHIHNYNSDESWLKTTDATIPESFMSFNIVSSNVLIPDDLSPSWPTTNMSPHLHAPVGRRLLSETNGLTDTFIDNNISEYDLLDDEIEPQDDEHVRDSLLSKLHWGRLTPSLSSTGSFQIYNDVKDVNTNRMYMSPASSPVSFHHDYLPRGVVRSLSKSDSSVSLPSKQDIKTSGRYTLIDPTIRDTFIIGKIQTSFDIRNYIDYHELIAYSTGKTHSTLRLSIYKHQGTKNYIKDEANITEIDLHSRIKTIKIPILSKAYARFSDIIAVITDRSLILIKIKSIDCNRDYRIKYHVLEPLSFTSLGDYPWADVTFNPMDPQQFAVVDTKGNYAIGTIPSPLRKSNKLSLNTKMRGTIYDPESLSSRKHISWSSKDSQILLMDESKLKEINILEKYQLEMVQAKSWSQILDFSEIDEDYRIMLTSMEIIVLRTSRDFDQTTRVMSWKHYLNSKDRTYRLFIQPVTLQDKQLYFTYITSKNHNRVYLHGFTLNRNDNTFQTLRSSTILDIPGLKNGIQTLQFVEESFENVDEGDALTLNLFIREVDTTSIIHMTESNVPKFKSNESDESLGLPETSNYLSNTYPELEFLTKNITKNIFASQKTKINSKESNDVQKFEEYGFHLSEALNKYITENDEENKIAPSLLSKLTNTPSNINDMEEFSSFLFQFLEHYKKEDIDFTDLTGIFKYIVQENTKDIDIFYNKLLEYWSILGQEAIVFTKEIVNELVWGTLKYSKTSSAKQQYDSTYHKLNSSSKDIIDEWDNCDMTDSFSDTNSTIPFSSQPQFTLNTQSQIPTIRSSQNRISKRNSTRGGLSRRIIRTASNIENSQLDSVIQNTLPSSMAPAFTLMGSSVPSTQSSQVSSIIPFQVGGSQRSKKKKKKVGGFN
ncbi:similar to Saccharomyces cerevisiae YBL014C RRN6 Component of the core factor (CF) rDNA transcription factor complex [Maudiozyma barnettii]|uniref:Similar to Saccharomyces cerevisiae YBL014C RRN6 Component of the core factor (CF) rDNA transcription factor complex n=1 Tax=Maudiozyma barnettii TaxID=61262 RepID=A0A8H2VGJ7_9SACH|nr:Rrn6p [Kazachstania barnettii]CAB4255087.1 similar to Saccharomyces cerevisiae YBL014C RRN6 Component of the core factor (CF) rDNA transcription factor complex [Kazachstania barnettii]CAD1783358.1 similar to Saccharomyces cerevisiae YBL014C RRN6 Component of the core factor (CF) rDNA transcription factor complex [Kazachstania barnettii]